MRTPLPLRILQNIQTLNWFILVASCDGAEGSVPGPAKRSETGGPKEPHPTEHRRRPAGPEDPSKPRGAPIGPQLAAAPIPRRCPDARTRVVPAPIARSMGCPQKQPSPHIRRVQHTVLSVAGLKGTMSKFELNLIRQRSLEALARRPGVENCSSVCQLAFAGRRTARLRSIQIGAFSRRSNSSSQRTANWEVRGRFCFGFGTNECACLQSHLTNSEKRLSGSCRYITASLTILSNPVYAATAVETFFSWSRSCYQPHRSHWPDKLLVSMLGALHSHVPSVFRSASCGRSSATPHETVAP